MSQNDVTSPVKLSAYIKDMYEEHLWYETVHFLLTVKCLQYDGHNVDIIRLAKPPDYPKITQRDLPRIDDEIIKLVHKFEELWPCCFLAAEWPKGMVLPTTTEDEREQIKDGL